MASTLTLTDVRYSYSGKFGTTDVLRGVTQTFLPGKIYAVVGKSGSGKTTLLSLMAGLDVPLSGEVRVNDRSTHNADLDRYRRECVSVVYQSFRLFPMLTALENVMYPLELAHVRLQAAQARAKACLKRVDLDEALYLRFPGALSGGEQQRVAIARALVTDTGVLLADEPTGNLDEGNSRRIVDILASLAHDSGYCVVVVTHDVGMLGSMDEVYRMQDGLLKPLTHAALQ